MLMPTIRGWKVVAIASVALSLIFVIFGGWRFGYSVYGLVMLAISGAVFGAIGAPELEPKAFRYPAVWQVAFSILGCILFAAALSASPESYALAVIVGVMLGYLAPYWIKHLQGP